MNGGELVATVFGIDLIQTNKANVVVVRYVRRSCYVPLPNFDDCVGRVIFGHGRDGKSHTNRVYRVRSGRRIPRSLKSVETALEILMAIYAVANARCR